MNEVSVNFRLTEKVKETAMNRFGKVLVEKENAMDRIHSHPIAAIERKLVEKQIHEELTTFVPGEGMIVDIGGSVWRNSSRGNVWTTAPVLSPADVIRKKRASKCNNDRACSHTAQECRCVEPAAYMSIHSLYYLTKDDIVDLVWRSTEGMMMCAVHFFPDACGGLLEGEATYTNRDGLVTMSVEGQTTPYFHRNLSWVRCDNYYYDGNRGIAWTAEVYNDSRETWIVTFCKCGKFDQNYCTDLGRPSNIILPYETYIETTLGGRVLYTTRSGAQVTVPTQLLAKAKMFISGKERSDVTYQHLYAYVRKEMRELENGTIDPAAIDVIVAQSFSEGVHREIAVRDFVLKKTSYYDILNERIKFIPGKNYFFWSLAVTALTTTVAVKTRCKALFKPTLLVLTGFLGSQVLSWRSYIADKASRLYHDWRASPSVSCFVGTLPSTTSNRELQPVAEGAGVDDRNVEMKTADKSEAIVPIGPYMSGSLPTCFNNNYPNQLTSLRNRCTQKVPLPSVGSFSSLNIIDYLDTSVEITAVSFATWNARFPGNRRKQHLKAQKSLEITPISTNDCTRATFVKVEKGLKSDSIGYTESDPRCIQGTSHRANVILGPWMLAFSKELSRQWSIGNTIVYAGGMTANDVGKWMEHAQRTRGVWIIVMGDDMLAVRNDGSTISYIENDFSRFDTTISREALKFEFSIYEAFGVPEQERFVLQQQLNTIGYTNLGIKYFCKGGRKSGDPNTSCGNSLINGIVSRHILVDLAATSEDHITSAYARFGFKSKTKVLYRLCDVEFCSKLFWTVGGKLILGPKPGRCLPKMGSSVKKLNLVEIKSFIKGQLVDGWFVPGVLEYLKCLLAIHHVSFEDLEKSKAYHEYINLHSELKYQTELPRESKFMFDARYGEIGVTTDMLIRELNEALAHSGPGDVVSTPSVELLREFDN
jgi:hypothetical protein